MPVVLPPNDVGYLDRGPINQVEEESRQEIKRLRTRQEEQLQGLDTRQKENLKAQADKYEKNAEDIRDSGNEAIASQRRKADAEYELLKRSNYDRFGRHNTSEVESLKKQLASAQKNYDDFRQHSSHEAVQSDERFENRIAELQNNYGREISDTAERASHNAAEGYETSLRNAKAEHIQDRDDKLDHFSQLSRENAIAKYRSDQETARQVADLEKGFEYQKHTANKLEEANLAKHEAVFQQRLRDMAYSNNQSMASQTEELRDRIGKFSEAESARPRLYAEGRAAGYREVEQDLALKQRLAMDSYEAQIQNLKRKISDVEQYEARRRSDMGEEKDRHLTDLLSRKELESYRASEDLKKSFLQNADQQKQMSKRSLQHVEEASDYRLDKAAREFESEIANQAEAYDQKFRSNNQLSAATIARLKQEKQMAETTTDVAKISPAAEEKIRNQINSQYEANFSEDRDRTKRAIDSTQQGYSERMRSGLSQKDADYTKVLRQANNQMADQGSTLLNHIREIEQQRDGAINEQKTAQNREIDRLMKTFAYSLEKQRRDYEDIMQTERQGFSTRTNALRQEMEFKSTMSQRDFAQKQNEIVREYEKRLADQKSDFKIVMDETKSGYEHKLREAERRQLVTLEEQAKAYEQRMAQTEAQMTERERKTASIHADETERLKRSYVLSSKKKG